MKKLLALLLALVMVFALVACTTNDNDADDDSGKKKEKGIADTWKWSLKIDGEMMGLEGLDGSFTMVTVIDLKEDGSYTVSIDEDALVASLEDFEDALVEYMIDMMGGDEEYRELAEESVAEMDLANSMKESIDEERGTYKVEGDQLTMTPEDDGDNEVTVYTFVLNGDTLELSGDNSDMEMLLEMTGEEKMVLKRA